MRNALKSLPVLIITTITVRLFFCFYAFPVFFQQHSTVGLQYSFDNYTEIAHSILSGNGFSLLDNTTVFHRPPLYSLLLTIPIFLSFGIGSLELILCQILNAILACIGVFYTVKTVQTICKNNFTAILSGYCIALFPYSIWVSRLTIAENILFMLIPITAYNLTKTIIKPSFKNTFLLGLTLGLVWLTHSSYILFILGTFLALLIQKNFPQKIKTLTIIFAGILTITTPWFIRNASHNFYSINTASGFGHHYFIGWYYFEKLRNNENYFGQQVATESHRYAEKIATQNNLPAISSDKDRSNITTIKAYDKLAFQHLVTHIPENILKVIIKLPLMWTQQQTLTRSIINLILLLPFLLFSLLALFKKDRFAVLVLLPPFLTSLGFSLVCVECAPMRYALPLFSLLVISAAIGFERIKKSYSQR